MLVAMCTSDPKHYIEQNNKSVSWIVLLVLSGKYLPQCTVDDLTVVCTIHQKRYSHNTHHF